MRPKRQTITETIGALILHEQAEAQFQEYDWSLTGHGDGVNWNERRQPYGWAPAQTAHKERRIHPAGQMPCFDIDTLHWRTARLLQRRTGPPKTPSTLEEERMDDGRRERQERHGVDADTQPADS